MFDFSSWIPGRLRASGRRAAEVRRRKSSSARRRLFEPETLESRRVMAIATQLVKDINNLTFTDGSNPYNYVEVGSTTFFVATTPGTGPELWKTDGTPAGTSLLKDINPGGQGSYARSLTNIGGTLYFGVYNLATNRTELWKSDGTTAGTEVIPVNDPQFSFGYVDKISQINGTLYFPARGTDGYELWQSDGTTAGTVQLKNIKPGVDGSYPSNLVTVNNAIYFTASGINGNELWRSDGTAAGTFQLKDINPGNYGSYPSSLSNVNGTLYFTARDAALGQELWKSNGTAAGTVMVTDLVPGQAGSYPGTIYNVNGQAYFAAWSAGFTSRELWKTNGTPAGTVRISDSNGPLNLGFDGNFANIGNTLYFVKGDFGSQQLWKTNGTTAGTVRVVDSAGDLNLGFNSQFTVVGSRLYFMGRSSTAGYELWRTDGTTAGTVLVDDIATGTAGSYPGSLTNIGGKLYFSAQDNTSGPEPWISNGTAAGTSRLKDINTAVGSNSAPQFLTNVGGTVFFSATDASSGTELWKSNGTAAGTVRVKDIEPGTDSSAPLDLININGILYFTASDAVAGRELWRSDGTPAGTYRVRNITPGADSSFPEKLTNVNGTLFFMASDPTHGRELWKSDGTTAGTVLVADLGTGVLGIYPSSLTNANGTLLFNPSVNNAGSELWRSDGTAAGTTMVKDIFPGFRGSYPGGGGFIIFDLPGGGTTVGGIPGAGGPAPLDIRPPIFFSNSGIVEVNGIAYFGATDPDAGLELWRSDGTAAGTYRVEDIEIGPADAQIASITNVNGTLFFAATESNGGTELWKSDGTLLGTQKVKDIIGGTDSSNPTNLYNFNGTLFFSAYTPSAGSELWKSDGTADGTVRLRDIFSGASGSNPGFFTELDGELFFSAQESAFGYELWRTDGTFSGTKRVLDIYTGSTSSTPRYLTNAGGTLFFAAANGTQGVELWRTVIINDPPQLVTNTGFTTYRGGAHYFTASELKATDLNQAATALQYTVVTDPTEGQIEYVSAPGARITNFTQDDINNNRVIYRHGGSANLSDSFVFTVNDVAGGTTPSATFNITLRTTSNTAQPVLRVNNVGGQVVNFERAENRPLNLVASATDGDQPNDSLVFSLITNPTDSFYGDDHAAVKIDPLTGVITFNTGYGDYENPLDVGADNLYEIGLQVVDESGNIGRQVLTLGVQDINDAPVFTTPLEIFRQETSVSVITFAADDPDLPAQKLTYNLVPVYDSNDFWINSVTGQLRYRGFTVGGFNFEDPTDADQDNVYVVEVEASDGRGQTTRQVFSIFVTPKNEFAPEFLTPLELSIPESVAGPQFTIDAEDKDYNEPGQVLTFHIAGGPDAGDFKIDALTGELSFASTPDYENPTDVGLDNKYEVVIEVRDNAATSPRSTLKTFQISVTPENESPPVITSLGGGNNGAISVAENQTSVVTITATDADRPVGSFNYSSAGGDDERLFFVNSVTGEVTFNSKPDFERPTDANRDGKYEIIVRVMDEGFLFDAQLITVTVTDANDAPVITSNGGRATADIDVPENTTAVTRVETRDDEGGLVQYSIVGGDDRLLFLINKNSGVLVFKSSPDFETKADDNRDGVYELMVEARDPLGATTQQKLRVRVTDARRNTVSVTKNTDGNIVIQDTASLGDSFTWTRVGANYVFTDLSSDPDSQVVVTGVTGATVNADKKAVTIPVTTVTATRKPVIINTGNGNDTVTLNARNQQVDSPVPGFGLSVNLGEGTDTLDVTGSSLNNIWTFSGNHTGRVAMSIFGSVNFSGIDIADGGSGTDTFKLPSSGSAGVSEVRGYSASDSGTSAKLDSIEITRQANFTLVNTSLKLDLPGTTTDITLTLSNIERAFLTGTAGVEKFDVSGWTKRGSNRAGDSFGGKIDGGGGVDTIVKAADAATFTLTDSQVAAGDGMILQLFGLENAELENSGSGASVFSFTGWRGRAQANGGSGNGDRVVIGGTFTQAAVENAAAIVDGRTIQLADIEHLTLNGNSGDQTVTLGNFSFASTTFNGNTGNDRVVVARNADFEIRNAYLKAGSFSVSLSQVESFTATGGPLANTFDITSWTGSGTIAGGDGNDRLVYSANADMTLREDRLLLGNRSISLTSIESAELTGGDGANRFTLDQWPASATIAGGNGADTLSVIGNGNFSVTNNRVQLGANKIDFSGLEGLTLSGGSNPLPDTFRLESSFFSAVLPAGLQIIAGGGKDSLLIADGAEDYAVLQNGNSSAEIRRNGTVLLSFAASSSIPEVLGFDLAGASSLLFRDWLGEAIVTDTANLKIQGNVDFVVNSAGLITAGNRPYTITQADRITLTAGSGANNFTINEATLVPGRLSIDGAGGNDTLRISTPENVDIFTDRLEFLRTAGTHTLSLTGIESVKVEGSAADQRFRVQGDGKFSINGGGGNDTLLFTRDADMRLTNSALIYGPLLTPATIGLSNIERVELTGGAGKNVIDATAFQKTTVLKGLAGDDILLGGGGNDLLDGGTGNDWLSGLAGRDQLRGDDDSDILSGGEDIDDLEGGTGDDIIIGGRTNYDVNKTAIALFIDRWASKLNFAGGVSTLGGGFQSGGDNYKLATSTVFDDDDSETLVGNTGLDWFFADIAPNNTVGRDTIDATGVETGAIVDL